MLVAVFSLLLTMVAGFVGPVSTVQILLSLLYSADSANMPFSMVEGVESRVRGYFLEITLSHFTLVWKLK